MFTDPVVPLPPSNVPPPLTVNTELDVSPDTFKTPEFTVVSPVYEFLPESTRRPLPFLIKPASPLMSLEKTPT